MTAFGTQENFERYHVARLLGEKPADRKRLAHLGYGNLREHHRNLQALLEEFRIPVEYRDGPACQRIGLMCADLPPHGPGNQGSGHSVALRQRLIGNELCSFE